MIAVLSWLVGIVDVAQFLPQARRVAARRHDRASIAGLSIWTWTIATVQGAAWVTYGFGEHLMAIALPNLLITPICALVLTLRIRARA